MNFDPKIDFNPKTDFDPKIDFELKTDFDPINGFQSKKTPENWVEWTSSNKLSKNVFQSALSVKSESPYLLLQLLRNSIKKDKRRL